jgi:hypothetical protein
MPEMARAFRAVVQGCRVEDHMPTTLPAVIWPGRLSHDSPSWATLYAWAAPPSRASRSGCMQAVTTFVGLRAQFTEISFRLKPTFEAH